jgi:hypothetical protein
MTQEPYGYAAVLPVASGYIYLFGDKVWDKEPSLIWQHRRSASLIVRAPRRLHPADPSPIPARSQGEQTGLERLFMGAFGASRNVSGNYT